MHNNQDGHMDGEMDAKMKINWEHLDSSLVYIISLIIKDVLLSWKILKITAISRLFRNPLMLLLEKL